MAEFTEQETLELRALLDAYKNGKNIGDLPRSDAVNGNLLLEVFNNEDQTSSHIPLSAIKGLVDVSGWTGVFPAANASAQPATTIGQITENWQFGAMYLIYYGTQTSVGGDWRNRTDFASVFLYPKDPTSVGVRDRVSLIAAARSTGVDNVTFQGMTELVGNSFKLYGDVIYRIYRVK